MNPDRIEKLIKVCKGELVALAASGRVYYGSVAFGSLVWVDSTPEPRTDPEIGPIGSWDSKASTAYLDSMKNSPVPMAAPVEEVAAAQESERMAVECSSRVAINHVDEDYPF